MQLINQFYSNVNLQHLIFGTVDSFGGAGYLTAQYLHAEYPNKGAWCDLSASFFHNISYFTSSQEKVFYVGMTVTFIPVLTGDFIIDKLKISESRKKKLIGLMALAVCVNQVITIAIHSIALYCSHLKRNEPFFGIFISAMATYCCVIASKDKIINSKNTARNFLLNN